MPATSPPWSWMLCQGQLLPISQYDALFALLGTTYGGDGITTFALPDLRGRTPVGAGQGAGLSSHQLGQAGGSNSTTLSVNNLATHAHAADMTVPVSSGNGSAGTPNQHVPASTTSPVYAAATSAGGQLAGVSATIGSSGNNQPVDVVQPYLAMNFVICVEGIFPSRN